MRSSWTTQQDLVWKGVEEEAQAQSVRDDTIVPSYPMELRLCSEGALELWVNVGNGTVVLEIITLEDDHSTSESLSRMEHRPACPSLSLQS